MEHKLFRLEGILTTNLNCVTFYWIWTGILLDCDIELHLLDTLLVFNLKILVLKVWITVIIFFYWIWTWKYLDYEFGFWLVFVLLDLDLKVLGLQIWITLIRFYWTWNYLDCDLGLRFIYKGFLELTCLVPGNAFWNAFYYIKQ